MIDRIESGKYRGFVTEDIFITWFIEVHKNHAELHLKLKDQKIFKIDFENGQFLEAFGRNLMEAAAAANVEAENEDPGSEFKYSDEDDDAGVENTPSEDGTTKADGSTNADSKSDAGA